MRRTLRSPKPSMLIQVTSSLSRCGKSSSQPTSFLSSRQSGPYSIKVMTGGISDMSPGSFSEPGDSPGARRRRLNMRRIVRAPIPKRKCEAHAASVENDFSPESGSEKVSDRCRIGQRLGRARGTGSSRERTGEVKLTRQHARIVGGGAVLGVCPPLDMNIETYV